MMTPDEARICADAINKNLRNTRELLLDLYEREGWRALGYETFRACVVAEFKQHQSYLYRQLEAAKAEIAISPIGEKSEVGKVPESHLRPLTSLPPDQQRDAYQKAVETAPNGKVTAKHVEKVVEGMNPRPKAEPCYVSDAQSFATIAISQLDRIRPDDPERANALTRVALWIEENK